MADADSRFAAALAAALAAAGVRHACVTPGSRSAQMTLALAGHPAITVWAHHDERSAAFFALGIAKATGVPAVAVTTSGTAVAELHPAVVEARYGRVPLIAISADRPAELRDVGAPQAIDQTKLFGDAVRWSHDLEPSVDAPPGFAAALGARLVAEAVAAPPGPVHLNLRFREPFRPPGADPAQPAAPRVAATVVRADSPAIDALADLVAGRRMLVVCGPQPDIRLGPAVAGLGARTGSPVIADPLSQCRVGIHDLDPILAGGDLLAGAGLLDRLPPEVVLRVGALPTSKPLWTWLAGHPEIPQIVVDLADWPDPLATAAEMVRAEPAATVAALSDRMERRAPDGWLEAWSAADSAARSALDASLAAESFPNEPSIARLVVDAIPDGSTLWAASSMPVRDLDLVTPTSRRDLRFAANRGANGIDGFISTGLGAAAAGDRPTYLLAGDLSLLHDATALATAARFGVPVTIVVTDNDGGGIFHFLPDAGAGSHFEPLFAAPHGLDLTRVAEAFGVPAARIERRAELEAALAVPPEGSRLLVLKTDRSENVAVHRRIRAAVARALA